MLEKTDNTHFTTYIDVEYEFPSDHKLTENAILS